MDSSLTVTDIFCGAGGNTIGAKAAGLKVRVGLNHWERAIDTYGLNNPEVEQIERVDVSLCDPRRYHSTDIAIMSPECTTHSPAGGSRHRGSHQPDLFSKSLDPATMRSRVTMFDVIRFTEYHRYNVVIIENVVEVTKWELFDEWLGMMLRLGYQHRILSLNSMFFWPTPQSRDRVYIAFWRQGNKAPDLDFRPLAPCPEHGHVNALQAWKNGRTVGKYKTQYVYTCPRCRREVTPFYFAALNAIDFTLPAERIGDRSRPLRPRTMERIEYGLKKFGHRQLVVQTNMTSRLASRVRDAEDSPMPTQPASVHHAVVSPPFLVTAQHSTGGPLARPGDGPMQTLAASSSPSLCLPPNFLVACANTGADKISPARVVAGDDPLRTIHAGGGNHALVQLPGFVVETVQTGRWGEQRRHRELSEPLRTQDTRQSSALVLPYIVANRTNNVARGADEAMAPVNTGGHHLLVQSAPFVTTAGSRDSDAGADDSMPTQTGTERLAVVQPFLATLRGTDADQMQHSSKSLHEPAPAFTGSGAHHAIVQGAALLSLRDVNAMHVGDLSEPTKTQIAAPQSALIAMTALPFLSPLYGANNAASVDQAAPTMTGLDRHGLVEPKALRVEDCFFRMLQPHEIGAAMAFPTDYEVGGTKRDRVKQYGNAVTPPVMDWIVGRAAQSLAPELDVPDQVGAA